MSLIEPLSTGASGTFPQRVGNVLSRYPAGSVTSAEPDFWRDALDLRQPKRQIAEYVEHEGLPVPERFGSLTTAVSAARSGTVIALRSEHPVEYDGPSGLLHTQVIDREHLREFGEVLLATSDPNKVLGEELRKSMGDRRLMRYLALTGTDRADFEGELSFSFWEYIQGRNVTIAADDAIAGRYHLFSINGVLGGRARDPSASGYVTDELGKTIQRAESGARLNKWERKRIIEHYETVRNLPAFSAKQCPIMEWQITEDGEPLFLQYHKSRPFQSAGDQLDPNNYPSAEGWVKAKAVRGALGELMTLHASLWYPGASDIRSDFALPDFEDASFDLMYDPGLSEALSRRRVASLVAKSFPRVYELMAIGHVERSRWFKSIASLALGDNGFYELIPLELNRTVTNLVFQERAMARVALDVASDGINGYARLNPDIEQPILG